MIDTVTLKDDFTFLVSNQAGEVERGPLGHGLYFEDTRYLSRMELLVDGQKPELLSNEIDYNISAIFQLNSHYNYKPSPDQLTPSISFQALSLARHRYIQHGLIENLEVTSYHPVPIQITLSVCLEVDFADLFEVRGFKRDFQGEYSRIEIPGDGRLINFYSVPRPPASSPRHTQFESDVLPDSYERLPVVNALNNLCGTEIRLDYRLELQPGQPFSLNLKVIPLTKASSSFQEGAQPGSFAQEVAKAHRVFDNWKRACTKIESDNPAFNQIFETSVMDLRSLMQQYPAGLVVTAGLPWYFTLFGRDSLITAIQTLSLNPQIALDTLRVLAAYQAPDYNDWQDSEPGKILHELRRGDMALMHEVPHGPYYGSIDSTLLFMLTFTETLKWRDDAAFFAELWPAVERALAWAEQYGDLDGDGYIKFKRRSSRGILHPGWKDSDESMGGPLGPRPEQPVALVEVQGYYYAALVGLGATLRRYGSPAQLQQAEKLEAQANRLKTNFNRDFWWPEESFFYQALDAHNKPIASITSNPGHCLWSGIITEDKARTVAARLMQSDMLSGWGIRTMSSLDPTYNPVSYHNGSVWPHDNSLIIAGLSRYGFEAEAREVARQIFAAAQTFPLSRLPELYCGFARLKDSLRANAPTAYPVSCSPQAWAAGAPVLILQSLLNLQPANPAKTIKLASIMLTELASPNL